MKNLVGINVRIILNDNTGYITITGKVVDVFERFLLLETNLGPLYVSFYAIKTIRVMGEEDEEK
jgi:RNase P/RNase MRP subunit p29